MLLKITMIKSSILALTYVIAFMLSVFLISKLANFMLRNYFKINKQILQNFNIIQHTSRLLFCSVMSIVYFYFLSPYVVKSCNENFLLNCILLTQSLDLVSNILVILLAVFIVLFLFSITNATLAGYRKSAESKSTNKQTDTQKLTFIMFYMKIIKTAILALSVLLTSSTIFHISFWTCLTSLGAATALVSFLFKDIILGIFAGLILTLEEIILIGDIIEVPQYSVKGIVEKVDLMFVSIRNSEGAISTIPTYNFMMSNIINSRDSTTSLPYL